MSDFKYEDREDQRVHRVLDQQHQHARNGADEGSEERDDVRHADDDREQRRRFEMQDEASEEAQHA
ncbi:MAG: hypothetical protein IK035_08170, partial [Firmicutes bacterium]|nr:hypothetical protein [Bacillota bacterium]